MNVRGQSLVVLVAAVIAAGITARLGVWQLSRATQKESLQASLDSRGAAPPLQAQALARSAAEAAGQHHRRITLEGRWVGARTVYLDNRPMDGRVGFYVVTPLALPDGDAVLVQRGWVPRDATDRSRLPPVATPEGLVQVEGRIAPPPSRLFELGAEQQGPIRQNLDLDAFGRESGLRLRPLSVQQIDVPGAPGAPSDGLLRRWPAPAVDVHKHYGYAFQWFALASLITGLYVWFQLVRPWLRRRA